MNRTAPFKPLGIKAAHTDLPIAIAPPIIGEIWMATRKMEHEKAEEPDNIPAEAMKSHIEITTNIYRVLFRKIWDEEQVPPTDWKEGYLIKIPKKDFADDLALLSQTQQQMQEMTTSVAAASAAVGLNIHKGKIKILRYNTKCNNPITIDGEDFEDAKIFTY
ncbi:unnamed protein product, partial [Schistosoma mattheei]